MTRILPFLSGLILGSTALAAAIALLLLLLPRGLVIIERNRSAWSCWGFLGFVKSPVFDVITTISGDLTIISAKIKQ